MASELGGKMTVVLGSAVVSTIGTAFGTVLNTVENRLKQLEQQGNRTTFLRKAVQEASDLEQQLAQVEEKGASAAIELQSKLDKVRDNLREQKVDVTRLSDTYQSLGRVMEGIEQQKQGMQSITEGKQLLAKARTSLTGMMKPVQTAAAFDETVGKVVLSAGVRDPEKRVDEKKNLTSKANEISRETKLSAGDAVGLVGQLVEQGLKLDKAMELAPAAAKFSVSQGVDQKDVVNLIGALSKSGVGTSAEMESVLGGYAAQAAAGELGIAEMTTSAIKLIPEMTSKGFKGVDSALQLGAMTQSQAAEGVDSAAANEKIKGVIASLKPGKPEDNAEQFKLAMGTSEKAATGYSTALGTSANGAETLENHMAQRKADPGYQLQAASNSLEELKRSYGAILLPVVGSAAQGFTTVTNALTDLMSKCQPVVLLVSGLAAVVAGLGAAAGAYRIGKGVVDVGRGLYKQSSGAAQGGDRGSVASSLSRLALNVLGIGGAGVSESGGAGSSGPSLAQGGNPVNVRVVNLGDMIWRPVGNAAASKQGKPKAAADATVTKSRAGSFQEGQGRRLSTDQKHETKGSEGYKSIYSTRVDTTSTAYHAGNSNNGAMDVSGRAVTTQGSSVGGSHSTSSSGISNNGVMGFSGRGVTTRGSDVGGSHSSYGPGIANDSVMSSFGESVTTRGSNAGGSHPTYGSALPNGGVMGFSGGQSATRGFNLGSSFSLGNLKAALKRAPGGNLVDGAMMALEVARSATTPEEKAEGLGAAAGSAGGSMAGGLIGATIGQFLIPIPGVGAAIGGMVGASLGGDAGADFGGWLGRLWGGGKEEAGHSRAQKAPVTESLSNLSLSGVIGEAVNMRTTSREQVVMSERGRAVANLPADVPSFSTLSLPAGGVQPSAPSVPTQQNITLSPSIPINVQGNITNPDDLIRMLAPAIQRMFSDLAERANRGGRNWDSPAVTYNA